MIKLLLYKKNIIYKFFLYHYTLIFNLKINYKNKINELNLISLAITTTFNELADSNEATKLNVVIVNANADATADTE